MKITENENLASLLDEEVKQNMALCKRNGKLRSKINDLEAEIERLTRENIALNRTAIPSSGTILKVGNALLFAENKEDYDITINTIKSEAYKEFAERVKKEFKNLEYQAKTKRKTVSIDELNSQMDWVLHEVALKTIDNLGKELTEKGGAE